MLFIELDYDGHYIEFFKVQRMKEKNDSILYRARANGNSNNFFHNEIFINHSV